MSHRFSIDIAVTETSLNEVEQIHEDGPDPERPGTKMKNTDMADTMNGVVTTKQHTEAFDVKTFLWRLFLQ